MPAPLLAVAPAVAGAGTAGAGAGTAGVAGAGGAGGGGMMSMMGAGGAGATQMGSSGAIPEAPSAMGVAGDVLDGAGKVMSIYGMYKGIKMAEKQYNEDKKRYEDSLKRMNRLDDLAQSQMNLGNIANFQQMAQGQEQQLQSQYGNYNRMMGK